MAESRLRRCAGGVSSLGLRAPAEVMRKFNGRTARVPRHEFGFLRRPKVLGSKSYFAAVVGYGSESTVRRYIEHQWDAVG